MDTKNTARDLFMYLLVLIVLIMSAVNLGTLLFQYVNLYVPDASIQQCFGTSCQDAIRWSLASIIVVFSVLYWAWRFLQRDVAKNPEKADSRVRRWLLYLTLFAAGAVLIGDAVSLLYSWLQGDLTLQFALKVLVVLYIAGTIFYYFLKELNPKKRGYAAVIGWTAVVIVIASVVAGFLTAGSPFRARLERLDQTRVNDLNTLQSQIVSVHWQSKGVLPETLDDLKDPINGFVAPVDPVTKQPYEYIRKAPRSFVLCATFDAAYASDSRTTQSYPVYPGSMNANWDHGTGRVCFDRTVDPDLYPVASPKGIK